MIADATATATLCVRCLNPLIREGAPCLVCPRPGESLRDPESIGPYRVARPLGGGPHGRVYACDSGAGTEVALKLFEPPGTTVTSPSERMLREIRVAARAAHPHTLEVHAVGKWRGHPFAVFELLDMRSLGDLIPEQGAMEPATALRIALDAAHGLRAASSHGVLHRNLKPSNLFVTAGGRGKLADFGSLGAGVEPTAFTAPEVLEGTACDVRSDIYALGRLLGCMLRGRVETTDLAAAVAGSTVLTDVFTRMTARAPEKRYADWDEVTCALEEAIDAIEECDRTTDALLSDTGPLPAAASAPALRTTGSVVAGLVLVLAASIALPVSAATTLPPAAPVAAVVAAPPAISGPATVAPVFGPAPAASSFEYVLGSEAAGAAFEQRVSIAPSGTARSRRSAAPPRREGGRLVVPAGTRAVLLHADRLAGDLDASLDAVLRPGATLRLTLYADDGHDLAVELAAAGARAGSSDDDACAVCVRVGLDPEPIGRSDHALAANVPHHIRVTRAGDYLRVAVDGRGVLHVPAPLTSPYRVALTAPDGGAELRTLRFLAARAL